VLCLDTPESERPLCHLVDLAAKTVIGLIDRTAGDLSCRLDRQPVDWRAEVMVVATDLAKSYPTALPGAWSAIRSPIRSAS
jgi:hypothetical protein